MDNRHLVIAVIVIVAYCNGFATALQCYVCQSDTTPGCATFESSIPIQNCIPEGGSCHVYITEDGHTVRSCNPPSEQLTIPPFSCDTDRCNSNAYPEDRRQCFQCVGSNCANSNVISAMEPTPCRRYLENDNCYDVHDPHGNIAYRGCVSDVPESIGISYCRDNIYQCNICRTNGCNNSTATYPSTPLSCVQCNSTQDTNCLSLNAGMESRVCSPVIIEYGPDSCYTRLENGVIYRGCLFEAEINEADCRNGGNCTLCSSNNCNVVKGLETCYNCTSEINNNCISNLSEDLRIECPLSLGLGCYLFDDGDSEVVKRGCLSSLQPDEIADCRREDQFCKTCSGDDCNVKATFQNCVSCTSSNDLNCFASNGTQPFPTKLCRNYLDTCFLHVSNNTVTRGCFIEDANQIITNDCPSNSAGQNLRCERCIGSNCNSRDVQTVEFCYECDSESNPNCRNNLNEAMRIQCPLAATNLGCYTFNDGGDIVKRGCVSSLIINEANECQQNGQFCKTCTGDSCNAKLDFQRCVQCTSNSDGSCYVTPTLEPTILCRDYSDVCFTHFENNVITRGCLAQSQLTEPCRNSDLCSTCQTPNCNDGTLTDEYCLRCNSEIDSNCASNVNLNFEVRCDLSVTPRGCFRYEDGGSIVRRGCVSDLVSGEVSVCRQQGSTCKTCIGRTCNAKESFTTCRACNSTSSVNCILSPTNQPTRLCRDYLDECFIHVKDDVLTRGCVSDNPQFAIDCSNPDICEKCSETNSCNSRFTEPEFCLTCDSETDSNCHTNLSLDMRRQCRLAVNLLGCYRFQENGGNIVKRGCLSELVQGERNYCRNQNQECKTCIGYDCNSKIEFQSCLRCNSVIDPNCVSELYDIPVAFCRDYMDECFTLLGEDFNVSRGCIAETAGFLTKPECEDNISCELCSNGLCNTKIIETETCFDCNSISNLNCDANPDITMSKVCAGLNFNDRKDGCYLYNNGTGSVRRGCVIDLVDEESALCRQQGTICKTCVGNDCNRKVYYQSCHICSSFSNIECVQPTPIMLPTTVCRNYTDLCVVVVDERGDTYRGCGNELPYNCDSELNICESCPNDNCNTQVVPWDRLRCHQCDGPNCSNVTVDSPSLQICRVFNNTNTCYTYAKDGQAYRGCGSDFDSNHETCESLGSDCVHCTSIGCNNNLLYHPPTISCVHCSNTEECAWGFDAGDATLCTEPVIFPYREGCLTNTYLNDTVERGCTNGDIDVCLPPSCDECTQTRCNIQNIAKQVCVTCSSDTSGEESCRNNDVSTGTFSRECIVDIYNYDQRGCFISHEGGVVRRGCFADLSVNNQTNCQSDEYESCFYCEGPECNMGVPPSGTVTLAHYTLLITGIYMFISYVLA